MKPEYKCYITQGGYKMKKEMLIEGMTCGHCKMRVVNALTEVEGVTSVDVDLDSKKATLEASEGITDSMLKDAVEEWGYEVKDIK